MKRILLLLFALLMTFCLAACSGALDDTDSDGITDTVDTEEGADNGEIYEGTTDIDEYTGEAVEQNTPPDVGLSWEQNGLTGMTYASLCTYGWTYVDEDGEPVSVTADSSHPLDITDMLTKIECSEVGYELTLNFDDSIIEYTVNRYLLDADYEDYINVLIDGNSLQLPNDAGSYVYELVVEYESGYAYYAFLTVDSAAPGTAPGAEAGTDTGGDTGTDAGGGEDGEPSSGNIDSEGVAVG